MKLEEEDIISMIMIEMGIIGIIEILEMIGMKEMIEITGIGFKNHKGMRLRNPTRMLGKR
jgi:CobQ-like glutamine amidotransferase family enzyme